MSSEDWSSHLVFSISRTILQNTTDLVVQEKLKKLEINFRDAIGSGKSSLCNIITGEKHDDSRDVFQSNSSRKSCCNETAGSHEKWLGHGSNVRIIEMPGLSDSCDENAKNITLDKILNKNYL